MEIFTDFAEPSGALVGPDARYAHVLAGVTWIGLLYFFNFVQVPAYAELSDGARSRGAPQAHVPGAVVVPLRGRCSPFLFGLVLVGIQGDGENWTTTSTGANGTAILTGMLLGLTMFLNVWGVIWRNQKIVIGNAENVAAGGEANPEAPAAAKRAARASRCNTLFSIPMLWFMVFAAHGGLLPRARSATHRRLLGVRAGPLGASSRRRRSGFVGGIDSPFNKAAFDKHRDTIVGGFVLLAVIYFVGWELILGA